AGLLVAVIAAGAGLISLDRAALPVPRQRRADHFLRGPRGDGLQRAVREDAVLPILAVGNARLARDDSGQGQGVDPGQRAAGPERAGVLGEAPCITSLRPSVAGSVACFVVFGAS